MDGEWIPLMTGFYSNLLTVAFAGSRNVNTEGFVVVYEKPSYGSLYTMVCIEEIGRRKLIFLPFEYILVERLLVKVNYCYGKGVQNCILC